MRKITICFLHATFLFFYSPTCGQSINHSPSYSSDTVKINDLIRKGEDCAFKGQSREALSYARLTQISSRKIGYKKGLCSGLAIQGKVLTDIGSYDSSLIVLQKAFVLAKDINDSTLQSSCLLKLGNAYLSAGNTTKALEYYFKGLTIEERLKKQLYLQAYFNNIGAMFIYRKDYAKALEYTLKSKQIIENNDNKKGLGRIYRNIGAIYLQLNKIDSARYAFEQSLTYAKISKDTFLINLYPSNMAELYMQVKNYEKAYFYSLQSFEISKAQGAKDQMIVNLSTLADIQMAQGKYDAAENHFMQALALSEEIKSKSISKELSLYLANLYDKKGNYKKAYEYYKRFSIIKDTLLNQENNKLIAEMNAKYTTEKKEKEIELLKKNEDIQKLELAKRKNELEKQRTISIAVSAGFILLMVVAILLFSRYRLKKKANDQLQNAFNLIEEKNAVIEKSSLMITDSITYAKRIQDAVLPSMEDLSLALPLDFFLIYEPAQIVSGDFYWCSSVHNKTIVIVADCTGHGVPGAFMSMIGNTLLNEIVNERKITDTKEIATLLDKKIIHALHQYEGSQSYDGMDISICCIDKQKNELTYTGAHHYMYSYTSTLQKIKGDSYSIGGAHHLSSKLFTSQTLTLNKGTCLYFFTDGYCDQSGGEHKKRFSSRQFENLIEKIHTYSMNNQKAEFSKAMQEWKGNIKQRDDILVLGIKC